MNYLAHGLPFLGGSPWRLAGTALPDWLRVMDRRLRIRPERAELVSLRDEGEDPAAGLAIGVRDHVVADRAFHTSDAFREATHAVAAALGPVRAAVPGVRSWFVAHVLVEVLLDAALVEEDPSRLDVYFGALTGLEPAALERHAAELTPAPPAGLADVFSGFVRARFVEDYLDDAGAARRLDQTFRRARQPLVGPALVPLLPDLRALVRSRRGGLVAARRPA